MHMEICPLLDDIECFAMDLEIICFLILIESKVNR